MKQVGVVSWEGGDWYQLWLLDGENTRKIAEGHELSKWDWMDLLEALGLPVQKAMVDDDIGALCHCKEPGEVGLMV